MKSQFDRRLVALELVSSRKVLWKIGIQQIRQRDLTDRYLSDGADNAASQSTSISVDGTDTVHLWDLLQSRDWEVVDLLRRYKGCFVGAYDRTWSPRRLSTLRGGRMASADGTSLS